MSTEFLSFAILLKSEMGPVVPLVEVKVTTTIHTMNFMVEWTSRTKMATTTRRVSTWSTGFS